MNGVWLPQEEFDRLTERARSADSEQARRNEETLNVNLLLEEIEALTNRLAKADKLAEALREVCDLAIWMSGSPSFAPDGGAGPGWRKNQPKLDRALAVLETWDADGA